MRSELSNLQLSLSHFFSTGACVTSDEDFIIGELGQALKSCRLWGFPGLNGISKQALKNLESPSYSSGIIQRGLEVCRGSSILENVFCSAPAEKREVPKCLVVFAAHLLEVVSQQYDRAPRLPTLFILLEL